ncbi:hypothetical protein ACSSS7_003255 [Eimeria intestinalis]
MKRLQRLLLQPLLLMPCLALLLLALHSAAVAFKSTRLKCAVPGGVGACEPTSFIGLIPIGKSSSRGSSSCVFSRGRFMIHPRLRVRRLSRGSGGSHLLELARQRLLLHREGDVERYMNTPIMPFPATGEIHSQRKRSKAPPPGALLTGPLALYRQTKMLLRKHRGTRNNRRVLSLRGRLTLLQKQQQELLCESTQPSHALLRKLWDLDEDESQRHRPQQRQQQAGASQPQQNYQKVNERLQQKMLRPLSSKSLFVCGVDLRAAATDLENLCQTITDHPVYAKLRKSKDGRHLGFGLLDFGSTLDATRCLLQLNGLRIGNSVIRLGEAFGPRRALGLEQVDHGTQQQQQASSTQQHRPPKYVHPYPLPCE